MMLCRVADSLFWMSRYIERAENTVRLVDVNLQILLETDGANSENIATFWYPIIESTGDLPVYNKLCTDFESRTVMDFLTFSRDNPSSVISCIAAARENARMIRDQISEDMWEIINRLYLFLKNTDPKKIWKTGPYEFYKEIREYSNLFQGVTESTFPHGVGYEFIQVGRFLERADKTGRILRAKILMDEYWAKTHDSNPLDAAQWLSVLRACSAGEAFQLTHSQQFEANNIVDFLVLSRRFPRSILFCANQLQKHVHAISECPVTHFSNEAERKCGILMSKLNYSKIDEICGSKTETFLAEIHNILDEIAVELNNRYMFFPIVDPSRESKVTATSTQESKMTQESKVTATSTQS
jgi:uncharacterized alpha-E superfamily protein